MSATLNPLLDFTGLPRFDTVTPEHVAPAIRKLLTENRALIKKLEAPATKATWADFVQPMTDAGEKLSRAWGIVGHLHSVNDVPEWREAYNGMLPEVSGFFAELGQNLALFAKYKALSESPEYATLTPARRRIIDNDVRDFRLAGAELAEAQKPRFKEIQEELSALAAKFSENVLDATNAHAEWVTDEADLSGIPADAKTTARAAAEKDGKQGWKFTLHAPAYVPVLQYADNRDLRARMYRASATRASEFGKAEWDNTPLINKLLALHAEEAKMLGYANYAEISLVPKMAQSPAQVAAFLRDLATKARPFAEKDVAELRAFARTELDLAQLEAWDMAYASEKLRQARYAFSDEEVKQYFPEPKVLAGLFRVIESIFSVKLEADSAPVWHPTVRFFRIIKNGELIGQFYLDLYARDTKRGGAWMDEAITRRRIVSGIQTPVAYLNCNFPAPVNGKPATFSHDDVITLFHECGHGLHHLLTRVEELPVSGHPRCRMGCSGTAQPVHGKLLLGVGRVARHDRARRDWRSAATRAVRQDDRGEEFPERHADPAPGRVRAVRPAGIWRLCAGRRQELHAVAGRSTARSRSDHTAGMEPFSAELLAHFRRRLRGRLLQLQVGRSAVGRRLRGFRGSVENEWYDARCGNRRTLSARDSFRRRLPSGHRIVQGLPWSRTEAGCTAKAQRDGDCIVV